MGQIPGIELQAAHEWQPGDRPKPRFRSLPQIEMRLSDTPGVLLTDRLAGDEGKVELAHPVGGVRPGGTVESNHNEAVVVVHIAYGTGEHLIGRIH